MIKIIDAKVPPLKSEQTKQREKLQEAKGLIVGDHTVHVFTDKDKVAEFIDQLQIFTSWLTARFINQDEE